MREAAAGLARNRVRAGLSMLGISWGIVSVVMLLAYGDGFQPALQRGFRGAFGDGVVDRCGPGRPACRPAASAPASASSSREEDVLSVQGCRS